MMDFESPSKLGGSLGISPQRNHGASLKSMRTESTYDVKNRNGTVLTLRGNVSPLKENGNSVLQRGGHGRSLSHMPSVDAMVECITGKWDAGFLQNYTIPKNHPHNDHVRALKIKPSNIVSQYDLLVWRAAGIPAPGHSLGHTLQYSEVPSGKFPKGAKASVFSETAKRKEFVPAPNCYEVKDFLTHPSILARSFGKAELVGYIDNEQYTSVFNASIGNYNPSYKLMEDSLSTSMKGG
jgi:hypothetical protein